MEAPYAQLAAFKSQNDTLVHLLLHLAIRRSRSNLLLLKHSHVRSKASIGRASTAIEMTHTSQIATGPARGLIGRCMDRISGG